MFAEAMAALYIYYLENADKHGKIPTLDRDGIRACSHPPRTAHAHMTIWTRLISCQLAQPPFKTAGKCPHGNGYTNMFVNIIFLAKS